MSKAIVAREELVQNVEELRKEVLCLADKMIDVDQEVVKLLRLADMQLRVIQSLCISVIRCLSKEGKL
jgi:hypothetical protein